MHILRLSFFFFSFFFFEWNVGTREPHARRNLRLHYDGTFHVASGNRENFSSIASRYYRTSSNLTCRGLDNLSLWLLRSLSLRRGPHSFRIRLRSRRVQSRISNRVCALFRSLPGKDCIMRSVSLSRHCRALSLIYLLNANFSRNRRTSGCRSLNHSRISGIREITRS